MSRSRYVPRSYLPVGHVFGAANRPMRQEAPADAVERARMRASYLQEKAAYLVLVRVRRRDVTRTDIQARTGWSRERLSRILNGAVVADLEDLHLLLDAVGIPFAELAWTGARADAEERQRLTLLLDYFTEQQEAMAAKIAQIERARRATSLR